MEKGKKTHNIYLASCVDQHTQEEVRFLLQLKRQVKTIGLRETVWRYRRRWQTGKARADICCVFKVRRDTSSGGRN